MKKSKMALGLTRYIFDAHCAETQTGPMDFFDDVSCFVCALNHRASGTDCRLSGHTGYSARDIFGKRIHWSDSMY